LLGYAAFLAIMSLILSFLLWYSTRNWRRERKKKQLEKEIRQEYANKHEQQPFDNNNEEILRRKKR